VSPDPLDPLVTIHLLPSGVALQVSPGTPLQDLLFAHGVEFPCGGRGKCKGCRVKAVAGSLPISLEDRQRLSPGELSAGWRLACRAKADTDLRLELAQWEAAILTDDSNFAFKPRVGLGIAIDLGTTTIVAQLLDLETGNVLAVRTALNQQARHGADIMSRIEFAVADRCQAVLQQIVRDQLGQMVQGLLEDAGRPQTGTSATPGGDPNLESIVIVGNTVMHHLFCGINLEPLSRFPFEPHTPGLHSFSTDNLNWPWAGDATIHFLPCLGGFVGSDILAGILATRLHEADSLSALVDLGTNGEIVVGNRDKLLCASTAAGPAFEGARISVGMRAATGAISEVHADEGRFGCHVIGNTTPRGICGSGLVDAIAVGLDLGLVQASGRLSKPGNLVLADPVALTQTDIREMQLAKGAIAAGLRLLLEQWGAQPPDLSGILLAGAFGNYINRTSAKRIGLLDFPLEKISASGNTALLGAKLALFSLPEHPGAYPGVLAKTRHISLNEDPRFQDVFVEEMGFPPG
jgi:uncharacterized 2Fe-2S/4Fe-4S cluster protein (DUF4445 family)